MNVTFSARIGKMDGPPKPDLFVFCLRFVCGAILGALLSLRLFFFRVGLFESTISVVLVTAVLVLGCGFGAAICGDNFWYDFFGR
jgi:hypothetical protein